MLFRSQVVCIGSILIDELYSCHQQALPGTSNPASVVKSIGGVMCNIVRNLTLLDVNTSFISIIGNDSDAEHIKTFFSDSGIKTDQIFNADVPTGKYVSILNKDGSLFSAVCADECSDFISTDFLESQSALLKDACLIIADTNLSVLALEWIISFSFNNNIKLIIEPVSNKKALKLSSERLDGIYLISPNEEELKYLTDNYYTDELDMVNHLLDHGVKNVWVSKGANGSSFYNKEGRVDLSVPEIKI